MARVPRRLIDLRTRQSGRSSGVEHDLAKVGVEGSNPFARSSDPPQDQRNYVSGSAVMRPLATFELHQSATAA
jgi:hypothetical protein